MAIIEFDHVTKRFGGVTALGGLSFAIPEGGIFGFLGANGAGKTTSLRLMMDIFRPDDGKITILGTTPSRENAVNIGFLPEERGLYPRMTVQDNLTFFARLRGMTPADARKAGAPLLERLGLDGQARNPVKTLSKGNAQKLQVATVLIAAPKLLLLDEPFSGLDPLAQQELLDLLQEIAGQGTTIVFSTHVMAQAERLCQSLLLLARGRLLFQGSMQEALASASAAGRQSTLHDMFLHYVGQELRGDAA